MTMENPFLKFKDWYQEADAYDGVKDASAVNLATASADGRPSNRMVLLKDYSEEGFVFYTNLNSKKGRQLAENPYASMCFYWEALGKQIRVEGKVEPVSDAEADAYFSSRALNSRIGAWASKQSQPLESRARLLKDVAKQTAKFLAKPVPRPPFWSGFCLTPLEIEFWQDGEFRIHKRICYTRKAEGQWQVEQLYP